jgi:hypothetical protein
MENKKDLAKIALAALILASAAPIHGQADIEAHGIVLAAGCAAHGCPAVKNGSNNNPSMRPSDQSSNDNNSQSFRTRNAPPVGTNPSGYSDSPTRNRADHFPTGPTAPISGERNSSESASPPGGSNGNSLSYLSYSYADYPYPHSGYNTQHSGITSPTYVEDYRGATYDSTPRPTPEYGGLTSFNHEYLTGIDYDYNRAAVTTSYSSATLTEAQLLSMLSPQGRAIYLSLDPEAKALAIQLASLDSYQNKDLAVRETQRRMNERRGLLNR